MPSLHKFGDLVYSRLTEEPSTFIFSLWGLSVVRRPLMGQDGIRHRFGWFFDSEIETLQEQTARTVATIQARNSIAEAEFGQGAAMPPLQFKKSN